jgi:phosphatidate cytidylyltransferase
VVERCLYEFVWINRRSGFQCLAYPLYAAGALFCLAQVTELRARQASAVTVVLFLLLLFALGLALASIKDLREYPGAAGSTIFGIIYVALTLSCLVPLRFSPRFSQTGTGRELTFLLFLVIWAGDIFAYFVGRLAGRTPLAPQISPHKTVEGSVGGLAGSLLAGSAFARWFWHPAHFGAVILLIVVIAFAGQLGDLAESALKRGADVKDSGSLLPGHGGLLDRVDSLLFGAPALWLVLSLKDFWPS